MNGVKYYSASFDNLVKGITAFVFVLFASIIWMQSYGFLQAGGQGPVWPLVLFILFFVTLLVVPWLMHITRYSLQNDSLVIHRTIRDVIINYRDIDSVEPVKTEDMRWTFRTFGNGGLFGIYGKFWNKRFGHMTWYATRRSNFILIKTRDGKKVVITPDDLTLAETLTTRLTG